MKAGERPLKAGVLKGVGCGAVAATLALTGGECRGSRTAYLRKKSELAEGMPLELSPQGASAERLRAFEKEATTAAVVAQLKERLAVEAGLQLSFADCGPDLTCSATADNSQVIHEGVVTSFGDGSATDASKDYVLVLTTYFT